MSIIYQPRGKAREYSELAANLYKGCSHGCVYCFAPSATFTDRNKFSSPDYISPRSDVIGQLQKDAIKFRGNTNPILLSFTSDPYQPIDKDTRITRQALGVLMQNNLTPQILTKSGSWGIERDHDILSRVKGIWAATLTTDNDAVSIEWEPGAALPGDRIEGIKIAKKAGLRTWVSFEPVFDPDAVYRLIEKTHRFVDLYKVGKLNYHRSSKNVDWKIFLMRVSAILDKFNCRRFIKKDLMAFAA